MAFQLRIPAFLFVILLSLQAWSQALAGGDSIDQKVWSLKNENALLKAELGLASRGGGYVILDLPTELDPAPVRIKLKNRGIVLREFDVESLRYRTTKGSIIAPAPLIRKNTLFYPKRNEIRPRKP
jgi:hypothetical protein